MFLLGILAGIALGVIALIVWAIGFHIFTVRKLLRGELPLLRAILNR